MSEIFTAFNYVDREKDVEFKSWNGAVSYLYDHYLSFTKKFIALRGIWLDGDWTMICDPEMVDVFDEEALEAVARMKNTTVLVFVAQESSNTYSFAKYGPAKEREYFIKEGQVMRSIGAELPEELLLGRKDDLIELARQFGIQLKIHSASTKFVVTELGYNEDLKQDFWDKQEKENAPAVYDRGNFVLFRKYPRLEETYQLVELLRENNIPYQIVNNAFSADLTFGGNPQADIELKLLKKDFERVDQLLEKVAQENLKNLPKDHYIYQFSEEELSDIIKKPDEWSKEDYLLAKQLLGDKGRTFTKETLEQIKQERIKDLSVPEGGDGFWTFLGYVFAVVGGIIGAIIGWHLMNFKKVLPNGDRVFNFKEDVRAHGKRIFIISIIFIILYNIVLFGSLSFL